MAQPLDTRLLVPVSARFPAGQAPLAQLRVGDLVRTADGTATITQLTAVVRQSMYSLTLGTGETVTASPDHLWRVCNAQMRTTVQATPEDVLLAGRLRTAAASVSDALALTSQSFADMYGLDAIPEQGVLEFQLGPVGFDDGHSRVHFPADEALTAVAAWLENGRQAPWMILTTQQMLDTDVDWWLPTYTPPVFTVSAQACAEAAALVDDLAAGRDIRLDDVRAGDQYRHQAVATALRTRFERDGSISGDVWHVPSSTAAVIADLLRGAGQQVSVADETLHVGAETHVPVVSIQPAGDAAARCIVIDHPDHLYLTEGWTLTHNHTEVR